MQIGDKAPEVLGHDENGNEIRLSDFKGKKLVLYFYPKDMTSGCTTEACNLRDNIGALEASGYAVLGASVDDAKSHQKFIAKHELPFHLIADTDKQLVEQFGVWDEKRTNSGASESSSRTRPRVAPRSRSILYISPLAPRPNVGGSRTIAS